MKDNKPTDTTPTRDRIAGLIKAISAGMYEREEVIAVSLLAALCGQNTFLYGPPGTAKSLISRRIACVFQKPTYFEYLMNRFSTPEEVFGPVSISALKEDRYIRKTDSYLPKADFAFLDEIWKSSPAILNTLLTLINERTFKNGETIEPVPLKALLAASNETPEINQGLEALYDRFIVRQMVLPIAEPRNFETLINSEPSSSDAKVPENIRVAPDEWRAWQQKIHSVKLSTETLIIIHLIREKLAELEPSTAVYVSDRRWQRAAMLMKAAAFFNGRMETNHSDALLLQHCLWTHENNYQEMKQIVSDAVKKSGIDVGINLAELDRKKEELDKEIHKELFHSSDVYETENIGGKKFFKLTWNRYSETMEIFIPYEKWKSKGNFTPLDKSGNEISYMNCTFDEQGACIISDFRQNISDFGHKKIEYKPTVLYHKGDKKDDINKRLILSMSSSVSDIKSQLQSTLEKVKKRFDCMESKLESLFVPKEKTNLAISGISEQINHLKIRIKDCERLEELCQ